MITNGDEYSGYYITYLFIWIFQQILEMDFNEKSLLNIQFVRAKAYSFNSYLNTQCNELKRKRQILWSIFDWNHTYDISKSTKTNNSSTNLLLCTVSFNFCTLTTTLIKSIRTNTFAQFNNQLLKAYYSFRDFKTPTSTILNTMQRLNENIDSSESFLEYPTFKSDKYFMRFFKLLIRPA